MRWKIVVAPDELLENSLYVAERSKRIVLWMYDRKRGKDKVVTKSMI